MEFNSLSVFFDPIQAFPAVRIEDIDAAIRANACIYNIGRIVEARRVEGLQWGQPEHHRAGNDGGANDSCEHAERFEGSDFRHPISGSKDEVDHHHLI